MIGEDNAGEERAEHLDHNFSYTRAKRACGTERQHNLERVEHAMNSRVSHARSRRSTLTPRSASLHVGLKL
jgi:hypothetical protein